MADYIFLEYHCQIFEEIPNPEVPSHHLESSLTEGLVIIDGPQNSKLQ